MLGRRKMIAMNSHAYDQIDSKQVTALIIMTIFPTLILLKPSILLRVNGKDAPWVLLLAIFSGFLFARISVVIYRKFPAQRQTQTFFIAFGRWVGSVFCFIYLLVTLSLLVLIFREFAELASWAFSYSDIPVSILLIMGGILAFVMSVSGIEVIARMCQLFLPVSILVILVILIAAVPWMNWSFLSPPIPEINQDLFLMAAHPALFFSEGLLIGMFFPHVQAKITELSRAMVSGMVWTGGICLITLIGLVAFFGGKLGGDLTMPLLHLSKSIRYGTFISNMQVLLVPFLVSSISIKMAIVLHAISLGFQDLLKLQSHRMAALFFAIISIAAALMLFDNKADLSHYHTKYGTYVLFPAFVTLTILPYSFVTLFHRARNGSA